MASSFGPSPLSRTRPVKLAMPPVSWPQPAAKAESSAPGSKAAPWTRIMRSAAGHGREQGHLVARRQRVLGPDVILVDRDPDDRAVGQRQGIAGAARLQPGEQLADIAHRGGRLDALLGQADPAPQP